MSASYRGFKVFMLGLMVLLFSLAGSGQQSPVPLPAGVQYVTSVEGINEYRLQNGLRVLLFPDPTKTNITVNITYMVGSRHEDYGETGMAHLMEHMIFKGSKNHTNINKELQDHGTQPNGSTAWDRTNYFETFQATEENLKWALDLESDRMVNSFVAKKDLDSEMTVVRNEFEAGENSPLSVLQKRTLSAAFQWHNYGHSPIGARSDIERVPIDRLQAFYRHFYQPDNALLVVAGKIDEAKTLVLVHQYFSPIPKPERQLRRTYTVEPTQDGERFVDLRRVGDIQAIFMVYHVPSGANEDFAAAETAASIFGDQPSGRLYKALVEPGKAAAVSAGSAALMEPGMMVAFAAVRQEKSMDDAQAAMLAAFDEIKSKPFTDEEVNRVKTQFLKNFELLMNNSQNVALQLSEWQAIGDWRLMFLHRDRVQKLTRDQVQQAAEKYFISSNRTIGRFYPEKNPVRAEMPPPPDVNALVSGYKSSVKIAKGEEFDPSPENIDRKTIRTDLKGGPRLSLLSKKSRGGQVNVIISLRFGDETSLKGRSNEASVAGQMLMRGTARHTRQQIKDEFDRLKAQVSISGGATTASANIQTVRENLKPVLDLVAEVFKEPSFPQNEFDELKQLALASLENQKSEPQAMAMIALQRHLSPYPKGDVRYVQSLDEQIEAFKTLDLDKVRAFYKDFYGASDSLVTVVGDFDPEAAQKQISDLFGSWNSPKKYVRVENKYQKLTPKAEVFPAPDKANAMWTTGEAFQMRDTDPDYAAMTLAGYIFGSSGMNSRLFARIRGKEGLSYGVSSQFSIPTQDDMAAFIAYAICAPQNAPKVEAVFKEELGKMLEKGFSSEEVEAAKKSWLQLQQVNRAQEAYLVNILTSRRFWNRTMAFDSELEKKIMTLTPEQLQAAVRKHIDPSQLGFFRAGDFQKANVTWQPPLP
jgi:zinc protease